MGMFVMCCNFNLHAVKGLLFYCSIFKLVILHNHFLNPLVLDMAGKGKLCVCVCVCECARESETGCSLFSTHYKQSVGHLILL